MKHTPTPEQLAIVAAAVETEDNLLVSALAGAAKTSTLELIANALPQRNAMCLAFNKRIATELGEKLPQGYEAKTLNALGHRAWADKIGKKLRLNKSKNYAILGQCIDDLHGLPKLAEECRETFALLLRTMGQAKSAGHIPDACHRERPKGKRLMTDDELFSAMEEEVSADVFDVLIAALRRSHDEAWRGEIDFNDQLLMPAIYGGLFPIYKLVLVDEAQDLSELNHLLLDRIVRKRLIAVGDQCQAIYAFRGAYEDGMARLQKRFNMVEYPLSVSFRCPAAVVEHVQWRASNMKAWDQSPAGAVTHLAAWSPEDLGPTPAIICRNNAPLLKLGLRLLQHGIYPNIWGNDIAAGIVGQLEKLGPPNMARSQALEAIADLHEQKAKRVRNQGLLRDKMECLRIFVREAETLGEAIIGAKQVFNSRGRVQLMTGHKAKGHEFPHVFFLNEEIVTDEGQDPNLRYVICTRAMESLTYITSTGWADAKVEYF